VTRYLSLAEYFWLAEQVTGIDGAVLTKASRVDLADSALHAPAGGFGDQDFYPDLIDKAAVRRWTLYWPDRNGRFHRYQDLPPGPIAALLDEIDGDPFGKFWG
jgi:death-on-curing protein